MATRHFATYSDARAHLRDLLDTAHTGRLTTVDRDRDRFAVVDAAILRPQLARLLPSRAVVAAEGGGWSAFLAGVPVSGEGTSLDAAIGDLIDALRDYAADWNDHLLDAPNHRQHWALVTLVELSDDGELRHWILADEPDSAPAPTR